MSLFRVRSLGPATPHPPSSRRVGRRLSHAIRVVTTQFDARSRPVSVLDDSVNAIGVASWGYDAVNRRVSASFTNGVASAFTYDLNNRLTSIQHASDGSLLPGSADLFDFSFGYDVVGNLLYKKDHIRTDRSEAYAYDDLNRLTLIERGVPNVADPTIIATPIDDARMPWTLDWTDAGGDPTLDQRGNWASVERTQRVGGNDTTESQARSLDAVGGAANEYYQIEHSGSPGPIEQLEYDEAGNLIAIYVMADMNCDGQVTSADIDGFTLAMTNPEQYAITYEDCLLALGDLNGDGYVTAADITLFTQMVTAAVGSDIAKRFTYDEENRLVSVSTLDDTLLHEYLYDALGRRILTHDHTVTPAVQTRHVYGAGFEPLAEYESSDNWETEDLAREFLWGERFPEPLVLIDWTTGPEKAYHYLHDHLGSVIALVDAGDPEAKPEPIPPKVVERYTYDPYGTTYIETWNGSGFDEVEASAYGNPFAWTAQRYDAGVGLYAFPFRGYSPSLGRFLQRDPLGYIDGPNLYEYVRSMPTYYVDSLGLCTTWEWMSGVCAAADNARATHRRVADMARDRGMDDLAEEAERDARCLGARTGAGLTAALDGAQQTLDGAGLLPIVGTGADLVNAGISVARGKYREAAGQLVGAIPITDAIKIGGAAAGLAADAVRKALRKGDNVAGGLVTGARRGMNNPKVRKAVTRGKEAHREFKERVMRKPGWTPNKRFKGPDGKTLEPDALDPKGRPVELKPNTPTGHKQGQRQIKKYKEAKKKNGRVIFYDP
jgi:RHS repeat-associated protein